MKTRTTHLFVLVLTLILGSSNLMLGQNNKEGKSEYMVVVNHEEQYSIVLSEQKTSYGWKDTGIKGNQKKCRDYIEEVWTDMRPLRIQKMNLKGKIYYQVVINHEEQYSIWPVNLVLSKELKATGFKGSLDDCTKHVKKVWTDMRPLSERKGIK